MDGKALITGFEPYGGRRVNPSGELAAALDGARLGDLVVVGRTLPGVFAGLAARIEACLAETRPQVVIPLGLSPGEPMILLARLALHLADFARPDHARALPRDELLHPDRAPAPSATLPVR